LLGITKIGPCVADFIEVDQMHGSGDSGAVFGEIVRERRLTARFSAGNI
jgi:hypothetical protein